MSDSCVYLTDDEAMLAGLRDSGKRAYRLTGEDTIDIGDAEVVVVGAGAKTNAMNLTTRGVRATRISYQDEPHTSSKHIFWDDVVPLSEIEADDDFPVYKSGVTFLDKNLLWGWRLPELGVIAGPYSSGKSTFGQILAANFVNGAGRQLNSGAMLCSWEDLSGEVKRNFRVFSNGIGVNDILDKVFFVRRAPHEDRLIPWYMDLVRYHRERYNTLFFLLDPWKRLGKS